MAHEHHHEEEGLKPDIIRIIAAALLLVNEGKTVTFPVRGYSMLPFIIGDVDSVQLKKPESIAVGHVVLAWVEGCRFVIHRIADISGEKVTLMGDGNVRGTEHCTTADVCGVVTEYLRPNGHVLLASDKGLQRKIRLWRRLLPIRRWLLFIYKTTV